MATNKIPVTITYIHGGALPPVFLAGSFSEPPWTPEEMTYTLATNGQYHFEKEVQLEADGSYQYKFRLGPGDWWVLDETAPVATDGAGNRNNVITAPAHSEPNIARSSTNPAVPQSDGTPLLAPQASDDTSISTLIVEKFDAKPQLSDDFGKNATVAQKDAHDIRAADAAPDYTAIRSDPESKEVADTAAEVADTGEKLGGKEGALDPRLQKIRCTDGRADESGSGAATPIELVADTAAEVADTAKELDKEPEPVPSDDEAGRTGERRISSTPVPEAAETVGEVADSAELIAGGEEGYQYDDNDCTGYGTGVQTPADEKAPLFAYEMIGENVSENGKDDHNGHARSRGTSSPPKPAFMDVDPDDPSLEQFPEDMEGIVRKISNTESRFEADETKFDGVPLSPVVGPSGSPLYSAGRESPLTPTTPPMEKIWEEDEEEEEKQKGVKETPKLRVTNPDNIGLGKLNDALADLDGKSPTGAVDVKQSGSVSGISAPLSTSEPTPAMDKFGRRETGILFGGPQSAAEATLGVIANPVATVAKGLGVDSGNDQSHTSYTSAKPKDETADQIKDNGPSPEQKLVQEQAQLNDEQKPSSSVGTVPKKAKTAVDKAKEYGTKTPPKAADIVETLESRAATSRDSSPAPKIKDAGVGLLNPSSATGSDTKDHSTGRAGRLEMSSDGACDSDEDKKAHVPPTVGSSSAVDTAAGDKAKDVEVRKRASVPVPERPSVESIRPRSASEGSVVKVNTGWLAAIWRGIFGGLFGWLGRIFGGVGKKRRERSGEVWDEGEGEGRSGDRSL